jgi:hypothetical protein
MYCAAAGKVVVATKPPTNAAIATALRIFTSFECQKASTGYSDRTAYVVISPEAVAWAEPDDPQGGMGSHSGVPHQRQSMSRTPMRQNGCGSANK